MDHKLCRVCFENSGNLNIFDTDCDGFDLSSKIMYCCAKIEINKNDGLPSFICSHCAEDLTTAYRFVSKCEATDKTLRAQSAEINSSKITRLETKVEIKFEETEYELDITDHEPGHYIPHEEIVSPIATLCHKPEIKTERSALKVKKIDKRRKKNPNNSTCLVCGRVCAHPSRLAAHMLSHTKEKPYQCEFCDGKYKDSITLRRHRETYHLKVRERKFICENCGKGFYTAPDLNNHLRVHTGEKPFACSECPSTFKQHSSLIKHKKTHRGEKDKVCDVCNKGFVNTSALRQHQQLHSSESFSCHICHAVFKYKHNLTSHLKQHSEQDSYVCNECGRGFNSKAKLKYHIIRVHSEEHPCSFESCPLSFSCKSKLDYHIAKIHEGRVAFHCEKCPKGFFRKGDLARHMSTTHKVKLL